MRKAAFIHTSPAAIGPVNAFYAAQAPSLEITNLLDDGILRMFSSGAHEAALDRLREMIGVARRVYGAEAALITCSSVSRESMNALRQESPIPVVKIDEPMAAAAVRAGKRIGVLYTFAPTWRPTSLLLAAAAADAGVEVELTPRLVPGAYDAILAGRVQEHDGLVTQAALQLAPGCDVVVLAQVSMAHLAAELEAQSGKPVFSSLAASLTVLRRELGEI